LAAVLFGLPYIAGVGALSWFGLGLMEDDERRVLRYFVPVAIFFPGLLGSDSVLSGNIAYILYGAVLVSTMRALKSGDWRWFYVIVVVASCFKAPLLYLVAIPLLCARRQWVPAGTASAAGIALFAIQPLLWPHLFHNYLEAVGLQFSFNRDFGISPAGSFGGWLFDHHLRYVPEELIFHLLYALPVCGLLIFMSHRYLQGELTERQWLPVMLVGIILVNPRLIEYDVAPIALPMAIICWRFFSQGRRFAETLVLVVPLFVAVNLVALSSWSLWKLTEGPLMLVFFGLGVMNVLRSTAAAREMLDASVVLTEA
jgi:hypothetical protein